MKKIFKIKFELIYSDNKSKNRDQKISTILSELRDIESDSPIPIPEDNATVTIGSDYFTVMSHEYSFNIIDNIFYYMTILKIKSNMGEVSGGDDYFTGLEEWYHF